MAGVARCWAVVAMLALAACQDANRIEVQHDAAIAAPRVFTWKLVPETSPRPWAGCRRRPAVSAISSKVAAST